MTTTQTDRTSKYEAPTLRVVGSIHELTLIDKMRGESDGYFLLTVGPITNASP